MFSNAIVLFFIHLIYFDQGFLSYFSCIYCLHFRIGSLYMKYHFLFPLRGVLTRLLLFRGMHVADHGKNRFSFFFIVRTNCKVSQYWLRKTFIDDFFFQANQWKCTSSPSFNQFSSSKERFLAWSSSLVSFIFIYLSIHLSSIFNKAIKLFFCLKLESIYWHFSHLSHNIVVSTMFWFVTKEQFFTRRQWLIFCTFAIFRRLALKPSVF